MALNGCLTLKVYSLQANTVEVAWRIHLIEKVINLTAYRVKMSFIRCSQLSFLTIELTQPPGSVYHRQCQTHCWQVSPLFNKTTGIRRYIYVNVEAGPVQCHCVFTGSNSMLKTKGLERKWKCWSIENRQNSTTSICAPLAEAGQSSLSCSTSRSVSL